MAHCQSLWACMTGSLRCKKCKVIDVVIKVSFHIPRLGNQTVIAV